MSNEASSKSTGKSSPKQPQGDKPGSNLQNKVSYLPDIHRLLPQSPDAEQGVLASILLDPRNVGGLCAEKLIKAEHFHLPAHGTIYAVLMELWDANKPIDFITLTQIMRDRGLLDQVGGAAFVTSLFTFLPTAANASYYLDILQEKYTLREIIRVCTEYAARSYDEQDDVPNLLNDVEQKVFTIAQDRFKDRTVSMKQMVVAAIGSIQELYDRRGSISGLSTGFPDFDKMTDGLHGAEMVIIAARPSMGKTALAMNMAEHIAVELKKSVAVFSLEMNAQQLVQRLLCSRARVNLGRVRDGFLSERDFPALQHAAGKLAEAKIFIDDTSGLSILELRAKARRLKSQHNIAAIFVDYLQLLRSTSKRGQDNRQLEIAEISSGLKAISKELNIPVVVLAQLNRNPEQRSGDSKGRPRLSDLRESGCLTGDTLIPLADTGARVSIRELAERSVQEPLNVWGVNDDLTLGVHRMVRVFSSGKKMVFELRTRSGRRIKASANHPFLKIDGWSPLADLKVGEHVALPRHLHCQTNDQTLADDELILLAHLLGDGCILPKQPYHYTSADAENLATVNAAADRLFQIKGRMVAQGNWHHLYLPSPKPLARGQKHPITTWYEHLGLERCRSYLKRLPDALFQCGDAQLSWFLKHLWATDGNISAKHMPGCQPSAAIYYASSSMTLAEQVQHLLMRLGILATMRRIPSAKGYRDMFHVHVEGRTGQLRFLSQIGCAGSRGQIIPGLIQQLKAIKPNPNCDVIPKTAWSLLVEPAKAAAGLGWREVCQILNTAYCGNTLFKSGISRSRMMRLAQGLASKPLAQFANSDVTWDKITEIIPLGEEETYDATVEGVHNFVANDIVVHNSIEQDADLVGLLVREEYYAENDDEKKEAEGKATLIIAKQRNGPVGDVKLTFLKEFTRFETRAESAEDRE